MVTNWKIILFTILGVVTMFSFQPLVSEVMIDEAYPNACVFKRVSIYPDLVAELRCGFGKEYRTYISHKEAYDLEHRTGPITLMCIIFQDGSGLVSCKI